MEELQAFEELKDLIHKKRGLDVNQYKENYLKRRLAVRMRALQLNTYEAYINWLETYKDEFNILIDKLTINVTQFFRDPEIFIEFESNILPEIIEKNRTIKAWSAGCSSGEEPYSMAMSIEAAAERTVSTCPDYEISATDIDDGVLYLAIAGKYEGRTLENIAEARRRKYFIFDGKNYIINEALKKHVKFIKANLMEPYKNNYFDVVFCRNVIIYFSKDLQRRVIGFFYDALKPGGIFFMGKTETMLMDMRDKFECINIKERIFRKIQKMDAGEKQ
jgi:chemotaxis protein methyltransferase CheR